MSGDSDFIPLIQRLRASNCQVIGVGFLTKTPPLIVAACNRFIPLIPADQEQPEVSSKQTKKKVISVKKEATAKKAATPKKTTVTKKVPIPKKAVTTTQTITKKKEVAVTAKEATDTTPAEKVVKPLDDPELTQKIEQAFTAIVTRQGKKSVLLVDVAKALKEGAPMLQAKDYGKNRLLFVIKARTDLFTFQQKATATL